MAKVTITFEDSDDGTTNVGFELDPPINSDDDPGTPAQWAGVEAFKYITEQLGGEPDNG